VYRFDGTETTVVDPRLPRTDSRYSFRLVADALALTVKSGTPGKEGPPLSLVTDAYAVSDDVLIVQRQLTSVNASGQIATMREPLNNSRQTYIYLRAQ
jgi:hypothetical protein